MNAKASLIVIALLLSAALVGCPSPTDVADEGRTAADNGSDNSGADTSTSGDSTTDGGGGDTSGDGSSTSGDGSSASEQPQGNGSSGQDASGGGSQDGNSSGSDDQSGGSSGDSDGSSDGGSGGGDVDVQPVFRGTYGGQIDCHKAESLMGLPGPQTDWTQAFSITFDESGIPTAFKIPGYLQAQGGIEFVAEVSQVGESVTLTETRGAYTATLTVTVAVATYNETSANVVLSLEHHGEQGGLIEDGTGMHVVQYELDGSNLAYSSLTTYEVMLAGQYDTTWEVERTGTLAPQ